jgi:ribosomal protein L11 methyltransferase
MGFGTGHHATTRLCLLALQHLELSGRAVLDVGTGSGVLAIAARLIGAGAVVGIDFDADAIQSARENLDLNPAAADVRLIVGDLRDSALRPADVVTANLTGALLVQSAAQLAALVRPGGTLVVSGLMTHERDGVVAAFAPAAQVVWEAQDDGWVGLAFNRGATIAV